MSTTKQHPDDTTPEAGASASRAPAPSVTTQSAASSSAPIPPATAQSADTPPTESPLPNAASSTAPTPSIRRRIALIAAALVIPFAFDRLVIAPPSFAGGAGATGWFPWGVLCLVILATGVLLFAGRARRTSMWWIVGAVAMFCASWLVVNDASLAADWRNASVPTPNFWYSLITGYLALPALLMLFLQLSSATFDIRRPATLIADWFRGWTVGPFSHWPLLIDTLARLVDTATHPDGNDVTSQSPETTLRKTGIALLISLPILCLLTPLLMQADEVFAYGVTHMFEHIDLTGFLFHAAVVVIPAPFLFSLLASVETRTTEPELDGLRRAERRRPFDPTIAAVVLGLVLALYAVFCIIQFTFLFAGAGLPAGYTYAEYARQGFFQLLFVAALNLAGYGVVMTFAPRTRTMIGLEIGLITATVAMLASSATRLGLYIAAYGMTWLRWLSLTFIALLAAILLLALVRLFRERLPLITVGFILILVWWVALGLSDPDWVIMSWNAKLGV